MNRMKRVWTAIIAAALAGCGDDRPAVQPQGLTDATVSAISVTAGPPASGRSERRVFGNWNATCDNGHRCAAHSGLGTGSWLMVRLDAGPEARPEILVNMSAISGVAIRLVIDGQSQTLIGPKGDAVAFSVPPADVPATLVRLAAAREVTLVAPDFENDIPTDGASAALLWIDERQGRLGTVTALIRKGGRPASTVPPAPALPAVVAARAISQSGFGDEAQTLPAALEALPAVKACRAETSYNADISQAVMSARLDASTELWAVPCFSGAYNIGHDWYVTGPGGRNPRPATLASADGKPSSGTVNGGYSAATRTMTAFSKGRGVGDCGLASTWMWTGRAFVLTEESAMDECEGMPPDLWPTTWRTR